MIAATLLLALASSPARCVPLTDVCAPEGATLSGQVQGGLGGRVDITSPAQVRALGASFSPREPVSVAVTPWSSTDGSRGAFVRVEGVLDGPQRLSGLTVEGRVALMQAQGARPRRPATLVLATAGSPGRFELDGFNAIELPAGTRLSGNVEVGAVKMSLTSPGPVSVAGLEFEAGEVKLVSGSAVRTVEGRLRGPQRLAGTGLEGPVAIDWSRADGGVRLREGQLTHPAPLSLLLPVSGSLPAGAYFTVWPAQTFVRTQAAVRVAGVELLGERGPDGSRGPLRFEWSPAGHRVRGDAADGGASIEPGLVLEGTIALVDVRDGAIGSVEGTLRAPAQRLGVRFARGPFSASVASSPAFAKGTLAGEQRVGELWAKGEAHVVEADGGVHLLSATLARPAPFDAWQLPAGTTLERRGSGFRFVTPATQPARLLPDAPAEAIDFVLEGSADAAGLWLTLARPWSPKGSGLSFSGSLHRSPQGCVTGEVPGGSTELFGFPKVAGATWCAGRVVDASGNWAVPDLRVGRWYATRAMAGDRRAPPPTQDSPLPPVLSVTPREGYWLQVNRLCVEQTGIPMPQEPSRQRWVFVDARGEPTTKEDRALLERDASNPGAPCPVEPCCRP